MKCLILAPLTLLILCCKKPVENEVSPIAPLESKFVESVFGGYENVEAIQLAEISTASLISLSPDARENSAKDREIIFTYSSYQTRESTIITSEILAKFKELILDPSINEPDSLKGCIPEYGVRVSFVDGDDTVAIHFCFRCGLLWVTKNEVSAGGGDFDPVHREVASLVKQLFPNDEVVNSL